MLLLEITLGHILGALGATRDRNLREVNLGALSFTESPSWGSRSNFPGSEPVANLRAFGSLLGSLPRAYPHAGQLQYIT
jgi:hypothetical protein